MKAEKLFRRDEAIRKRAGWSAMAFIAPEFPEPRTVEERVAMSIINQRFPQTYMAHIYSIEEALEEAFRMGREAAQAPKGRKKASGG
jgi:hypothetical protein